MAAKRRRKRNIKEDQLVTTAVRLSQWTQAHLNQVIAGVVVLVGVIAVLVFTSYSRQGASRESGRLMASAMSLFQSGEYEAAKTNFQQVYQRYSGQNALAARFFTGECELRKGNFTPALAEYDEYLARAEKDATFRPSAIAGKAVCYEGLGNFAEAARTLTELMAAVDPKDPRYLDAAMRAGEFFARAGNNEEAVKHFRIVADDGTGAMKDRATVALAMLER